MAQEFITNEQFTVVGISARTSNRAEMAGGIIGKQWQRFMSEGLLQQIPNRVDENMISLYTDYESDVNGEYTFVIGAKVRTIDQLPTGMHPFDVPAGRYAKFTSDQGTVSNVVIGTWRHIWSATPEQLGGARAYKADYEVYDERAKDPNEAIVDVFVGIK